MAHCWAMLGKYQVSDPQNHGSYPIFLSIGSYNCIPANPLNNKSPTKRSKKSHPEKKINKKHLRTCFNRVVGISDHFPTIFPEKSPEITIFLPPSASGPRARSRHRSKGHPRWPRLTVAARAWRDCYRIYLFTIIPWLYNMVIYI